MRPMRRVAHSGQSRCNKSRGNQPGKQVFLEAALLILLLYSHFTCLFCSVLFCLLVSKRHYRQCSSIYFVRWFADPLVLASTRIDSRKPGVCLRVYADSVSTFLYLVSVEGPVARCVLLRGHGNSKRACFHTARSGRSRRWGRQRG